MRARRTQDGFTLVELMVSVALFVMIFFSIWATMNFGFQVIRGSQARVEATTIANEYLELVRNLSYDDIGTVGGIPAGTLTADQVLPRNGINFTVNTDVVYVDDVFDGVSPADTISTDYKRVRVAISWIGSTGATSTPVLAITDVVPKGLEGAGTGGTLRITVFDSLGQPVTSADVRIVNNDVVPAIDTTLQTNSSGQVVIPGSPVCTDCYQVTASKTSYSTERTYGSGEVFEPAKPHATVIDGQITDISFSIDQVSSLTTTVFQDSSTSTISSLPVTLTGAKSIGNDSGGSPVLKFVTNGTTDAQGQVQFSNLEWDSYMLSVSGTSTGYAISNEIPTQPLSLLANITATSSLDMATHTTHSLLASVKDSGNDPISGASVRLQNVGLSYDTTLTSATSSGQAFFGGLSNVNYTVDITATGFVPFSGQITASSTMRSTFTLNPS